MKHPETAELARAALERSGMTQDAFADMLRAGRRTVRWWLAGEKPPSGPAQLLLEEIRGGWLPTAERAKRAS